MKLSNSLSVFVARRRWLKRFILKNYPASIPSTAWHNLFNKYKFYFDPRDMRGPSFHLAYDLEKGFENYEWQSKQEILKNLPSEGVFYDIGANIGLFTTYIAQKRPDVTVHSFEPEKLAFECLQKNIEPFSDQKISIHNKAIGTKTNQKKLFKSSSNDGAHTLIEGNSENDSEFQIVEVINLDEQIEKSNLPLPDVIKIDVEGFELDVIKGLKQTIVKSKPFMLIECSNKDLSEKGEFWQALYSFKENGIYASEVGKDTKLNLNMLSELASKNFEKKLSLNNYIFNFQ